MAKVLISPLMLTILTLILLCVVLRPRRQTQGLSLGAPRTSAAPAIAWFLLCVVTLLVTGLSIPKVAAGLAGTLERMHPYPSEERLASVETITVLSGGLNLGAGAQRAELGSSTYWRTSVGIKAFFESGARELVMQGSGSVGDQGLMVRLMGDLAQAAGVPQNALILEPRSLNTMAHPVELRRFEWISPDAPLGVVTSAWHLPRAVREFERYYAQVVPIPADYYSRQLRGGVRDWLPQVEALDASTTVLHEWVGLVWYRVQRR